VEERKVKQSLNIVKKHVRLSVDIFFGVPKHLGRRKSARDAELSIFSVDVFLLVVPIYK
jgi:hypothetical protein